MTDAQEPNPVSINGLGQRRIALIGVGVAVIIAIAAVVGWWVMSAGAAQGNGAIAGAPGSSGPTTTPIPKSVEPNHTFKSQSGNLRCSVGTFSGQPGAICQQVSVNYPVPAGACPGNVGVFVGVGPDGAYWPCFVIWRDPAEVIAYDTPVTRAGVTCVINAVAGAKCVNAEGKGFTMEFDAGVATF